MVLIDALALLNLNILVRRRPAIKGGAKLDPAAQQECTTKASKFSENATPSKAVRSSR